MQAYFWTFVKMNNHRYIVEIFLSDTADQF